MKPQKVILAVFILMTQLAYSQKEKFEPYNSIGLKVYTPINLTGTDKFYNENWLLYARQSRSNYKYAFGLDIKHYFTENISFKLWGGISKRTIEESSYEEIPFYPSGVTEPVIVSENISYDQTSFNISPGINFSGKINKFEFNTGFELSYLHTGTGNLDYSGSLRQYVDPKTKDSLSILQNIDISSGDSYGIGVYIGAEYNIFNNLSAGVEFHEFLFYSVFNRNTNYDTRQYEKYGEFDPFINHENTQRKENFKQLSFTNLLPVFEIKYKFGK
jgi:hypothetical protein